MGLRGHQTTIWVTEEGIQHRCLYLLAREHLPRCENIKGKAINIERYLSAVKKPSATIPQVLTTSSSGPTIINSLLPILLLANL